MHFTLIGTGINNSYFKFGESRLWKVKALRLVLDMHHNFHHCRNPTLKFHTGKTSWPTMFYDTTFKMYMYICKLNLVTTSQCKVSLRTSNILDDTVIFENGLGLYPHPFPKMLSQMEHHTTRLNSILQDEGMHPLASWKGKRGSTWEYLSDKKGNPVESELTVFLWNIV